MYLINNTISTNSYITCVNFHEKKEQIQKLQFFQNFHIDFNILYYKMSKKIITKKWYTIVLS